MPRASNRETLYLKACAAPPSRVHFGGALKSLLSLLEIVCAGDQAKYKAFLNTSAGQKAMKEHGLNEADLASTMRVLSIGALAASKNRLTYTEISSALGLWPGRCGNASRGGDCPRRARGYHGSI